METITTKMLSQFARDINDGLSAPSKSLPSRYFYDAAGDKIFQEIMRMPEYYLTDCEYEIFNRQKDEILKTIHPGEKFNLVELGAGDGYKTKILLEHFLNQGVDFEYFPVDISGDVLQELRTDLLVKWPELRVTLLNYEYLAALEKLNTLDSSPNVILFLGSNIGNFTPQRADLFFNKLNEVMHTGDKLMSGIDLKKDPKVILAAYNDATGITRSFNMNLLERINRELGGHFDLTHFDHYPTYDPLTGEARSYLISTVRQEVYIDALNKSFLFEKAEPVHMEISRKYSLTEIEALAHNAGFGVKKHFTDSKEYFVDTLWEK